MYEDDDELEVVSETSVHESAGDVQTVEFDEGGLPGREEIAAALDEAKDVIEVEDSLHLCTDEEDDAGRSTMFGAGCRRCGSRNNLQKIPDQTRLKCPASFGRAIFLSSKTLHLTTL